MTAQRRFSCLSSRSLQSKRCKIEAADATEVPDGKFFRIGLSAGPGNPRPSQAFPEVTRKHRNRHIKFAEERCHIGRPDSVIRFRARRVPGAPLRRFHLLQPRQGQTDRGRAAIGHAEAWQALVSAPRAARVSRRYEPVGDAASVAVDREGARRVALSDLARLAGGCPLALGRQGGRVLARAQERRHAVRSA